MRLASVPRCATVLWQLATANDVRKAIANTWTRCRCVPMTCPPTQSQLHPRGRGWIPEAAPGHRCHELTKAPAASATFPRPADQHALGRRRLHAVRLPPRPGRMFDRETRAGDLRHPESRLESLLGLGCCGRPQTLLRRLAEQSQHSRPQFRERAPALLFGVGSPGNREDPENDAGPQARPPPRGLHCGQPAVSDTCAQADSLFGWRHSRRSAAKRRTQRVFSSRQPDADSACAQSSRAWYRHDQQT